MVERRIKQKAVVMSDHASLMSGGRQTISFYDAVRVLDANNGHTWMTILGCMYNLMAILSAAQECSLNKTTFHGVRWDSEPNLCWNGFHIEICQQGALQQAQKVPNKKIQIYSQQCTINAFVHAQRKKGWRIFQKGKEAGWLTADWKVKSERGLRQVLSFQGLGHGSVFWRRPRCHRVGLSVQTRLHEQDMSPLWMKWSAQIGNEIVGPDALLRCRALLNVQYWQSDQTLKRWPLVHLLVRTKRRFLIPIQLPIQTKFYGKTKEKKIEKEEDIPSWPEGSIVLWLRT